MSIGTFRLILSIFVLIGHSSYNSFLSAIGINIAVTSVAIFFIISGFLNTFLIEKYYTKKKIKDFYIDRFFRIAPQLYFYLIITIILDFFFQLYDINFLKFFFNLFIISLGYFKLLDNIFGIDNQSLFINPVWWSIGLEFTFYLIIPILILKLRKLINYTYFLSLIFLCFVVFFLPNYEDALGYRLLPGVLFIFLVGSKLNYCEISNSKILILTLTILIFLLSYIIQDDLYEYNYLKSVIVGTLIGSIILNFIKKRKSNKIDLFFGDISYGIFLNHYIIINILNDKFNFYANSFLNLIVIILISFLISLLSFYLIEKKVTEIRRIKRLS